MKTRLSILRKALADYDRAAEVAEAARQTRDEAFKIVADADDVLDPSIEPRKSPSWFRVPMHDSAPAIRTHPSDHAPFGP